MPWLSCILSNVALASLLALAAWFVQRRLGRHAVARVLWVLVLVKLVTPPVVSVPLGEPSGSMACTLGVCNCEKHAWMPTSVRDSLPWLLLAGWSAGASVMTWTAWLRWTQFQRLMAHASPASAEWQSLAAHLASELSIRRTPEILTVPGRLPPLVVAGVRRPRMLLPMDLMGRLDASQKSALLMHELVHLQRGDHLVRILELAVAIIYWWLPIVGSIGRQLRACEETCCDAVVVARLPQARRDYARLLLDVLDFTNPLPRKTVPQTTAMSVANDLELRLQSILSASQGTRRTWPVAALAVGLACAILPCGLRFDFVRLSAASSTAIAPASGATLVPGGARKIDPFSASCCPS